jgi:hypothetical protein
MMAGHSLLQILSSFVIVFFYLTGFFIFFSNFPTIFSYFCLFSRSWYCCLAGVCLFYLLCIYLNDAVNFALTFIRFSCKKWEHFFTAKPYAFWLRSWTALTNISYDFFDSCCASLIRIDLQVGLLGIT